MQLTNGYDNASGERTKDDLGRWRFALDIADLIRTTPSDWSVRIGLFGKWGSGKSTVLRYISGYLEDHGYIVMSLSPASTENLGELLSQFGVS